MHQAVRLRDVAEALHLSETTVSRALSGKGRVSEATRQAVADYIRNSGYRPNMLAKGLAQSRAFSICALLPPDAMDSKQSFFQNCLMGICEGAESADYSVLITTVRDYDSTRLERSLAMENADGYILMRAVKDDPIAGLLQERGVPFVLIGSSDRPGVVCVDEENEVRCRDLTRRVLCDGFRRPGLLVGDTSYFVNCSRLRGFEQGVQGEPGVTPAGVFTDVGNGDRLREALEQLLHCCCDCVFCGDDVVSARVLRMLREMEVSLPIISFYGSELLDLAGGVYAAVQSDAHGLGIAAVKKLLDLIEDNGGE